MRALAPFARSCIALLAALLLVFAGVLPAFAQNTEAERLHLDELFEELKAAPDANEAHRIDQQIWMIWTLPSEQGLAGRMAAVLEARDMMDLGRALELLDVLVKDYPTYAEGWNQRATIRYMLNDFEGSLADIDKVLEFEPRHFGALSGQALILLSQGKRALALKAITAALAVHPFLNERQLFPELSPEATQI